MWAVGNRAAAILAMLLAGDRERSDVGESAGVAAAANATAFAERTSSVPRFAYVPMGVGVIVGALLGPWLDRRKLRKDIERTSPRPAKPKP